MTASGCHHTDNEQVPIDIMHALLCLGYYHEQINRTDKVTDRGHRSDDTSMATTKGREDIRVDDRSEACISDSAREAQAPPCDATDNGTQMPPHNDHPSDSSINKENSITLSPAKKACTYHPLLSRHLTSTARLLLLTTWDGLMITILSLHIFSYFRNIASSMAFCHTAAVLHYPDWASNLHKADSRHGTLYFGIKTRCERMNWNIHSAGGFSSAGAALLAALHLFAMVWRALDFARPRWRRWRRKNSKPEEDRKGEPLTLDEWACGPRDIDIRFRATCPPTGFGDRNSGHATTISEEEQNTGTRQKRGFAHRGKSTGSESTPMWSEAMLECLVP